MAGRYMAELWIEAIGLFAGILGILPGFLKFERFGLTNATMGFLLLPLV